MASFLGIASSDNLQQKSNEITRQLEDMFARNIINEVEKKVILSFITHHDFGSITSSEGRIEEYVQRSNITLQNLLCDKTENIRQELIRKVSGWVLEMYAAYMDDIANIWGGEGQPLRHQSNVINRQDRQNGLQGKFI